MLIKLELECTPLELIGIGQVMEGHTPVVLDTPLTRCTMSESIASAAETVIQTTEGAVTIQAEEVKPGDTVVISGATGPDADAINGEHQITSPAADAFAADADLNEIAEAAGIKRQEASAATTTVELAKGTNGQMIPWDARIHGKAKKQNADGSWRLVQGVDRDTLVPQVEAELVAALTAPKPVAVAAEQSNIQVEPVTSAVPVAASVVNTPLAPAAAPTVPEPPVTTAVTKPTTFPELLPLVTAAKAAGTLTDETIANACAELGLATFGLIATRPDLIPQAAELLGV